MVRRGSGLGLLPVLLVIVVIGGILAYDPAVLFPQAQTLEVGPAVALSNQIKNLPTIDDPTCRGSSSLVGNVATIIQSMDGTLGTGFGHVAQLDTAKCDVVLQYVPILGTYNSLIHDARTLDPNNSTSVRNLYQDAFLLSSDFALLNDKVIFKVAFKATGEINDALKLGKLRSLCGDGCYRVVLSGIHWTIRVNLNQSLCEFEDWAGKTLADKAYC
jgi:hypothetical protein